MYYQQLLAESKRLEAQIKQLEQEISKYPEGHLISSRYGNYINWYQVIEKNRIYIPKSNLTLVDLLATKKYLSLLLLDTIHHKQLLDRYLKQYASYSRLAEAYASSPLYSPHISNSKVLTPSSLSLDCHKWLDTPFTPNPSHPENLIHKSISGHMLRSKSEVMIDTMLYLNNIPFKYESPLVLDGVTYYPDFTLYRPSNGQLVYWDHFGLIDEPNYRKTFLSKLNSYISNGLIPNINLIMTFETKNNPLNSTQIQNMISQFLLDTPQYLQI